MSGTTLFNSGAAALKSLFGTPPNTPNSASPFNTSPLNPNNIPKMTIGPAEVTTPNVAAKPAAATPPPPTPAPTQTPAPQPTQADFNSAANGTMAAINAAVQPNVLNQFYQSTYHFRFFVMADGDMITQNNIKSMSELYQGVDNAKQITIAESGVTGFNIKSVVLRTASAQNAQTRAQAVNLGTMTITEPLGLSFLDAFTEAAQILQLKSWPKASYYLELRFLGYDESGNIVSGQKTTDTIGRWIWQLKPSTIEVTINEGGGSYVLTFSGNESLYLTDQYDLMRIPAPVNAKGDTLKAFFADFLQNLNAVISNKYGGPLVVFDAIVTNPVKACFVHPSGTNTDKDPGEFKMKPQEPEKNPSRNWTMDNKTGLYSVQVSPGIHINEFIIDAIKHTEEAQSLAKDDSNVTTQTDASPASTNERGFREAITWTVEPIIRDTQFDHTTGHYVKHITLNVTPYYTLIPLVSRAQGDKTATPQVQKDMVTHLLDNGLIRKKYDYIFTGLNTEVLDFDLNFNLAYSVLTPAYSGALMRYDAFATNARLNVANLPPGNQPEVKEKVVLQDWDKSPLPSAGQTPAPSPTTASTGRVAAGATPGAQVTQSSNNIYIEDLLATVAQSADNDYTVPLSLWQGYKDVDSNSGQGKMTGEMNRDQSIIGAIWSQALKVDQYQNANMTIRGDPFWLGQSNLHRQILLANSSINVKSNPLISYANGDQHIYVYFRYPMDAVNEFKPSLKSSAVFNGLYMVTDVVHTFSDGVFKQELHGVRQPLIDPPKWAMASSPNATNGGPSSNPQQTSPTQAKPPSTGTSPASLGNKGGTFAQQAPGIMQKLQTDFHLTPEQAAGVMGNLGAESGGLKTLQEVNPTVAGSKGGYGWAQWTGSRRTDFFNYAQANNLDPASPDANYGFLKQELSGPYASSITAVKQTNNVGDATAAFEQHYERAGVVNMPLRVNYANTAYNAANAAPSNNSTVIR